MKILLLALALTFALTGCVAEEPVEGATAFATANLKRVTVDGVDCIVGVGNFDTTVALSCDWAR